MAVEWTTPKTWTVGELARAADLNTYIRDNLLYLYDPPRCAVRLSSTQSISDSTDTAISWDEAVWDSHGDMWDNGAPTRVTITRDGVYTIICSALWSEDATNRRALFLEVNGSRRRGQQQQASLPIEHQLAVETNLADGDYIEIVARQNSGGTESLVPTRTVMTVRWSAAAPTTGE